MTKLHDRRTLALYLFFGLSLLVNAPLIPLSAYWIYLRGGLRHVTLSAVKGNPPVYAVSNRRDLFRSFDHAGHPIEPIVMFGDSLTAAGLWGEWFGPTVMNRGIPGETSADALLRVSDISVLRPSKVFLLIGTNDYGSLRIQETESNVRQIVNQLRTTSPSTQIYLESLLPPPSRAREDWVTQVNASFKQLAEDDHLHWVDLCPSFADGPVIDRKLTLDGVHLTPQGYEVWRKDVEPFLLAPAAHLPAAATIDVRAQK